MTTPELDGQTVIPGVTRRRFITGSAAAGLAAAGLEGILAARRAPALAQGTKVHILRWVDFIPEADVELKRQAPEASKALGAEVTFEFINANDLQARITAAIQSGSGADIIQMLWNWPHLYANGLVDVSDVAEPIGKAQGGYYDVFSSTSKVGNRWLAWADTNTNRAFHSGDISATLNGASIYIVAKRQKDKLKDEKGEPLYQDIEHEALLPKGPGGQFALYGAFQHSIMKYSKNQKAAKELLKWMHQKENYGKWFQVNEGYTVGATKAWEDDPMWSKVDKPLQVFRQAARQTRMLGYPGPSSAKATESYTKYIVVDMYAKACQGMKAEDAVKWAESELKKIYEV